MAEGCLRTRLRGLVYVEVYVLCEAPSASRLFPVKLLKLEAGEELNDDGVVAMSFGCLEDR